MTKSSSQTRDKGETTGEPLTLLQMLNQREKRQSITPESKTAAIVTVHEEGEEMHVTPYSQTNHNLLAIRRDVDFERLALSLPRFEQSSSGNDLIQIWGTFTLKEVYASTPAKEAVHAVVDSLLEGNIDGCFFEAVEIDGLISEGHPAFLHVSFKAYYSAVAPGEKNAWYWRFQLEPAIKRVLSVVGEPLQWQLLCVNIQNSEVVKGEIKQRKRSQASLLGTGTTRALTLNHNPATRWIAKAHGNDSHKSGVYDAFLSEVGLLGTPSDKAGQSVVTRWSLGWPAQQSFVETQYATEMNQTRPYIGEMLWTWLGYEDIDATELDLTKLLGRQARVIIVNGGVSDKGEALPPLIPLVLPSSED